MKINSYKSIRKPTVHCDVNIEQWFSQIKHSNYSDLIEKARRGEVDYDITKTTKLPAVTFNFYFNKYKNNGNIVCPTGLLYIDVDKEGFDPSNVVMTHVMSTYKSFGGKGYAIIVRVDGLEEKSFKKQYLQVCRALGVIDYIDRSAIKATQFSALSYDPDIVTNLDATPFILTTEPEPERTTITPYKKKITRSEYKTLRFDNLDDYEISGDFISDFEEGYQWVRCFIPSRKIAIKRQEFLLSFCNNLVWLNPFSTKEEIFNTMQGVNYVGCIEAVSDERLSKIVDSVFKYKDDDTLKPLMSPKNRSIIFDKGSPYTKEEKQEVVLQILAEKRRQESYNKISNTLESWDFQKQGKITQQKLAKESKLNIKTVEKYYPEFRTEITEYNKEQRPSTSATTKVKITNTQEKEDMNTVSLNEVKAIESKRKISEAIDNWDTQKDGKISIRKLVDKHKINKKTVAKHWFEFKETVENINSKIKK